MTPSDQSRDAKAAWEERYAKGRVATQTRQEYWSDFDSGWVMAAELVSATLLWGGIGWLIDRWLGTAPWLMVVGFLLGNATGFYLVYLRATGRIGKPGAPAANTTGDRHDHG